MSKNKKTTTKARRNSKASATKASKAVVNLSIRLTKGQTLASPTTTDPRKNKSYMKVGIGTFLKVTDSDRATEIILLGSLVGDKGFYAVEGTQDSNNKVTSIFIGLGDSKQECADDIVYQVHASGEAIFEQEGETTFNTIPESYSLSR